MSTEEQSRAGVGGVGAMLQTEIASLPLLDYEVSERGTRESRDRS